MKKLILFLVWASISFSLFAETIILKSGKTVEGKIIEKAKGKIKVDIGGIPITYYTEDIDSINGQSASAFLGPEYAGPDKNTSDYIKLLEKDSAELKKWQNWHAGVSGYLNQMGIIGHKAGQIGAIARKQMQGQDQETKLRIFAEAIQGIETLIKQTESISPPVELSRYHQKRLQLLGLSLTLHKEIRNNPAGRPKEAMQKMQTITIEEMEELRRVYIEQGAPPEFLGQVDLAISYAKQVMENIRQQMEEQYDRQ